MSAIGTGHVLQASLLPQGSSARLLSPKYHNTDDDKQLSFLNCMLACPPQKKNSYWCYITTIYLLLFAVLDVTLKRHTTAMSRYWAEHFFTFCRRYEQIHSTNWPCQWHLAWHLTFSDSVLAQPNRRKQPKFSSRDITLTEFHLLRCCSFSLISFFYTTLYIISSP